jgi:hypothetical protein
MRRIGIFNACLCAAVIMIATVVASVFVTGCSASDASGASSSPGSRGGSMARFAIVGDWLYTVDDTYLRTVSLADPAGPSEGHRVWIGSQIETIFPLGDKLFIGSQGAMYIYDIANTPGSPEFVSSTSHFKSCDPVVAYGNLAFVTLNSSLGSWCGQRGNVLKIYDITNLGNPVWLKDVPLYSPRGLAVDGAKNLLFVCDDGVKAFDIANPREPRQLYTNLDPLVDEVGRIDAYDCIVWPDESRLMVVGSDGLYQLGYDNEKFTLISRLGLRTE